MNIIFKTIDSNKEKSKYHFDLFINRREKIGGFGITRGKAWGVTVFVPFVVFGIAWDTEPQ